LKGSLATIGASRSCVVRVQNARRKFHVRLPMARARATFSQRFKRAAKRKGGVNMKLRTLFVTSLLPVCSAALIFTGCDRERNAGAPASETSRTVGQKVDDKEMGSRVKDALNDNTAYKFPDVKVNVYNGKVQLSGFVQTREQKTKAEDIAKSMTSGVTVENKITVKE
jgi:hypothetical protein